MPGAHWTPQEKAQLWYWAGYRTAETIGRKLGRSAGGVQAKATRLGIRLYGGLSLRRVSEHLGYSRETVLRMLDIMEESVRRVACNRILISVDQLERLEHYVRTVHRHSWQHPDRLRQRWRRETEKLGSDPMKEW